MDECKRIAKRREDLVVEMLSIRSMLRGSITEQILKAPGATGAKPRMQGPYYVLSRNVEGRTKSRRVKAGADLDRVRADVAAHARFVQLCREFESLTERLGELEATDPEFKKKRRS